MFNFDTVLRKRTFAFTIDLGIIITTNYFLMAAFTDFLKIVFFHFPIKTQLLLIHKFKLFNSVSVLSLMFAYFTVFYFVTNGKTMGKMLMGLTVKSENKEMSLKECMLRSITYIFCAWFASIPFIISFIRKDQKSLADLFSGTNVFMEEMNPINIQQTEFQLSLLDAIKEDEVEIGNSENKAA